MNEQKVAVTSYGRNKNHHDKIKKKQEKANNSPSYRCAAIKKHSRTSPDAQFKKNFHCLNKKLDPERTIKELGNPFIKKSRKTENQFQLKCVRVKMPLVNKKPLARIRNLVQTKN